MTSCVLSLINGDDEIHMRCVLCDISEGGSAVTSEVGSFWAMYIKHPSVVGMASQGARAEPVVGREELGESAEGSVAPATAGAVDIRREGVGVDAPIPPGGTPANHKDGATEFEGTLYPEIAEKWWKKVEDMLNLVDCTLENRLMYVASMFVGNALNWWRSVKRAYEPREITWAEFQREFDDKYRPKMYRDKKRMEFLNLVQGDD
ncbi:UNVERIFIED_CONTAM: hypothetical protein Slati_1344700 [Sesamum latifolium]|uniref:Retrotransposon gag domain-containing protein n=1 Tax=Sesamum latifolium TaxID=2727402 RepID=A0AAW2XIR9_9LAMI